MLDQWTSRIESTGCGFHLGEVVSVKSPVDEVVEEGCTPLLSGGAPIDVAVITKGDGFLWLERKRYCSPELSPRFIARCYNRNRRL